jgi:phasin
MTDPATKNHNVLLEMSTLAEHGVEQARKAFDELMNATHRAVQTFEGQTTAAQATARDLQQQAMDFAARNVTATFEFAQNLVRAKSAEEVANLHADFVSAQMKALAGQARELTEMASSTSRTPQKGAA